MHEEERNLNFFCAKQPYLYMDLCLFPNLIMILFMQNDNLDLLD